MYTDIQDLRGAAGFTGQLLSASAAGPEFSASLEKGVPFYDSILASHIGYDVLAIGNHEFDFGPDVLENFIAGIRGKPGF
jgi:2',3'-cyclic-nucleotide 2'-phosphodiesterase (5'-nucleotidase family)